MNLLFSLCIHHSKEAASYIGVGASGVSQEVSFEAKANIL
jgi:hypothetical protein